MDCISLAISFAALISSIFIGIRQVKISNLQADMQNKVELYLLTNIFTYRHVTGEEPDRIVPAIYIRNIGNNVIYLNNYIFNGREYPLGKEVLPPVSAYDGYHYIELPTDGTTHVSFEINFLDWKGRAWKTKGFADFIARAWEITYSPCEKA